MGSRQRHRCRRRSCCWALPYRGTLKIRAADRRYHITCTRSATRASRTTRFKVSRNGRYKIRASTAETSGASGQGRRCGPRLFATAPESRSPHGHAAWTSSRDHADLPPAAPRLSLSPAGDSDARRSAAIGLREKRQPLARRRGVGAVQCYRDPLRGEVLDVLPILERDA